jgi:hypothetical protein
MLKLAGKGDEVKLTIQVLKIALVPSFVTVKSIDAAPPMLANVLPPAKGLTRMDGED